MHIQDIQLPQIMLEGRIKLQQKMDQYIQQIKTSKAIHQRLK